MACDKTLEQEMQEAGERYLVEHVARMAERLRNLADRIEREVKPYTLPSGERVTAMSRIRRIHHEITWEIPNVTIENLFEDALLADTPGEDLK